MAAVIFTVDDEAGMGRPRLGNDEVLAAAAANPDVLIPFASVDPHKGKLAVREARRMIEAGARGEHELGPFRELVQRQPAANVGLLQRGCRTLTIGVGGEHGTIVATRELGHPAGGGPLRLVA